MSDIKSRAQLLNPNAEAKNLGELVERTGNIYEALAIISVRAKRLRTDMKKELSHKLEQFVETGDTIEEIAENKEQIEISKSYERLPNPALIATEEYLTDQLHAEYKNIDKDLEDF